MARNVDYMLNHGLAAAPQLILTVPLLLTASPRSRPPAPLPRAGSTYDWTALLTTCLAGSLYLDMLEAHEQVGTCAALNYVVVGRPFKSSHDQGIVACSIACAWCAVGR